MRSMVKKWSRLLHVLGLIAVTGLILCMGKPASAQDELSFVYGTNHYNGAVFNSTFVPPSINTFYLIANNTSMIASKMTRVYYWPLTNELKPDWDQANISVDGTLEILKNNTLFKSIEITNYVIQYDAQDKFNTLQLYLGEDAVAARTNFEALQDQYREDLFSYHQALDAYREKFEAALADLQAGNITEDEMPERPEPLQDLTLFSTNLLVGFPINLPEGTYQVQLRRPDGSIQPDSQKKLVVFNPVRKGIGYKVFAEERWTAPEETKDVNEIIYSLPGRRIYFEPFYQIEFNELYYTRLNNPQDKQARRDRNIWVPFEFVQDAKLIQQSAQKREEIEMKDYFVHQIAGSALGYQIEEHDPESDTEVSFRGFEVEVDSSAIQIKLVDQGGTSLTNSPRELRVLQTYNSIWIFVISGLPLVGGIVAVLLRRGSVDTEKANEQEY